MKIIRNTINPELSDTVKVIVCPCCLEAFLSDECRHRYRESYSGKIIRKRSVAFEITCPKCNSQWITDKRVVGKFLNPKIREKSGLIFLIVIFMLGLILRVCGLFLSMDIISAIGLIMMAVSALIAINHKF